MLLGRMTWRHPGDCPSHHSTGNSCHRIQHYQRVHDQFVRTAVRGENDTHILISGHHEYGVGKLGSYGLQGLSAGKQFADGKDSSACEQLDEILCQSGVLDE